ncbi:MAG TPA: alpha/beta hydrolase [Verrucomicrobiae bacterium]|nr:alpha/beta hydrolase [Verrucomicrobiae bacterium]
MDDTKVLPPLESGIAAFVAALREEMKAAPALVTAEDRRIWFNIRGEKFRIPVPDRVRTIDHFVCAPGREIPIRRYRPVGAEHPPLIVYFHGGGWVCGGIASHEMITAQMALETGAEVISVHYRRPPENPYPAAFEDCLYVVQWAIDNQARLAIDGARVAVAGDSAGGNLAAAIAIAATHSGGPELRAQGLIYPVVDTNPDRPSYKAGRDPFLLRDNMIYYLNAYLQGRLDIGDPRAMPMRVKTTAGLPPAYVLAADHDVLLDEAVDYARRLSEGGVATELRVVPGTMHGFLRARAYSELARREFTLMCEWIKDRLKT